MTYRILDLFCGAGGAAMGYSRAGFEVVGVDLNPQPRYPFEFHQADALACLEWLMDVHPGDVPPPSFDAIHASPPCQGYSQLRNMSNSRAHEYPKLIGPVRELLQATGLPYVIENVQAASAELRDPVKLCGSTFGIGVRRHRMFEVSFPLTQPACAHRLQPEPIDVTGTGGPCARKSHGAGGIHRKPRNLAQAREAMGIDWMTRLELNEAIPPAYTEFIGAQLVTHLNSTSNQAA